MLPFVVNIDVYKMPILLAIFANFFHVEIILDLICCFFRPSKDFTVFIKDDYRMMLMISDTLRLRRRRQRAKCCSQLADPEAIGHTAVQFAAR